MAVDITKCHAKFFLNTCKKKCKNGKKTCIFISLFLQHHKCCVFFYGYFTRYCKGLVQ